MPTLWKIQAGDTIPTDCCHSDGSGFFRDCDRAMRLTTEHTLDTLRAANVMRLDAEEAAALAAALAGEHGEAWLFGSRLDPARLTAKQPDLLARIRKAGSHEHRANWSLALCSFRTWDRLREAAPSETFRDVLLRMEKVELISGMQIWLDLRDIRNRIAHEYLPEELAKNLRRHGRAGWCGVSTVTRQSSRIRASASGHNQG